MTDAEEGFVASAKKLPSVAQLRAEYSAEEIQQWSTSWLEGQFMATAFLPLTYLRDEKTVAAWTLDYLRWVIDECGVSVNAYVIRWPACFCTLLDSVVLHLNGSIHDPTVLNFVLNRGGRSSESLDWALKQLCFTSMDRNVFEQEYCVRRLLDAGARSGLLDGRQRAVPLMLYRSRRACRRACYAVLALIKRRRDLRDRVAPDVWRMIAKWLWQHHRFAYFVAPE